MHVVIFEKEPIPRIVFDAILNAGYLIVLLDDSVFSISGLQQLDEQRTACIYAPARNIGAKSVRINIKAVAFFTQETELINFLSPPIN